MKHPLTAMITASSSVPRWALCLLMMLAAAIPNAARAQQPAGQVQHLQGMATAQQPGAAARFIAAGDSIAEGDVITTTEKGYAVVAFTDGTKITLRPATTFAVERYAHNEGTEAGLMRLIKGGMRAVTGLINKINPGALQFRASTATIGIRGTSFDARLCNEDCRSEDRAAQSRPPPAAVLASDLVVARLIKVSGDVTAQQEGKPVRHLLEGAPLYMGDALQTGPDATALVGFRDQSRLAVNPQTLVRINGFSYSSARQPNNFALQLLHGGLRMFTGLIAKAQPQAVSVRTLVATIGIRGTGMDISCEGPCADGAGTGEGASPAPALLAAGDGLFMHTWLGLTFLDGGGSSVDVPLDAVGFVGADRMPRLLAALPEFMNSFKVPRPDMESVDWDALFGAQAYSGEDGLYLFVRDGHVFLETANGRRDFGVGEAGFVGGDNLPRRLAPPVPRFLSDDPFPIPELFVSGDKRILQLFGATLGQPGQEICRL
ncbi:FecR domain-containing protein [Rhodoferax sp. GW822-FHT02A01]|uniref:FecR family protein n=1 Tax=Rhodoferax sp. GW822-FHT02A01 TaxID=3141537 RepID=UPI00315C5F33